ncbi:NAD-dependent epimerase/dehydratase family protein [Chelativorans sp. ZYF759]|uniref:NAD-dependent epimerase/dehydratase family protein n=1 Tax=Chelativorans sp. ZYF759 TaxID=2692213 RepID=UPI00145C580F|nr:NAD-dependent epimerase/dehydratase family protein [Chelativorans sp. ZYF759]NMG39322.1 NAD-dependent epimerase/dehydratase family protein [Chelativorans sp. ZYF759]
MNAWPIEIRNEDELEELLSRPSDQLVKTLAGVDGDITILGVGGKMGPTLARMAKRAAPGKRVIGVARFSEPGLKDKLHRWDIETVECDLLDPAAVEKLEKTANVVFMAGRKFGSAGNQSLTWAMNVHVPAIVAEAFQEARIVAFSTACVYPFVDIAGQGAREDLELNPPGEYANSCVGRERMFEHFSRTRGTKVSLIRLSYAIDLRYGVLHDVASAVQAGEPVQIDSGHCNVIWQGDANDIALQLLAHADSPPFVLNLSGPELVSVRRLAEKFGEKFGTEPVLAGREQDMAWIVDTSLQQQLFGYPSVPLPRLIDWTARWLSDGGRSLGKPTHFEVRDGTY